MKRAEETTVLKGERTFDQKVLAVVLCLLFLVWNLNLSVLLSYAADPVLDPDANQPVIDPSSVEDPASNTIPSGSIPGDPSALTLAVVSDIIINNDEAVTNTRDAEITLINADPNATHYSVAVNKTGGADFSPLQELNGSTVQVRLPNYEGRNYVNFRLHGSGGEVLKWLWDDIVYQKALIQINNNDPSTTQREITVSILEAAPNITHYSYAVNKTAAGDFSALQSFSDTVSITLPNNFGKKNYVNIRLHDSSGRVMAWLWDAIDLQRPAVTAAVNGGDAQTESRNVMVSFNGDTSALTHARFAFNNTADAAFGPLQTFSTGMPVVLPDFFGTNYVNIKLYNAAGEVVKWLWDAIQLTPPPLAAVCFGGDQPTCDFLLQQDSLGLAAGNIGDYYHNRDNFHSSLIMGLYPQLGLMSGGFGPELGFYDDRAVIGNSSTAFREGENWGSDVRNIIMGGQFTADAVYQQYTHNNLYLYPEHQDHDLKDQFHAAMPYVITSQGSSGTEIDELIKLVYASAAFKPEVKTKLMEEGLLAPTLQMIFRRTRVADDPAYLTGAAHPSAFDNLDNSLKMAQMANQINLDDIPPMIQLQVLEEDFDAIPGTDYFEKPGLSEQLFDTPASIARIYRGGSGTKRMLLSAEGSYDVNGNPLTYEWAVLRGEGKVQINPLNAEGSVVEVIIEYHPETTIEGDTRLTNLVEIGAFVHNGTYYSAPGFVTSFTLDNEDRAYDAGGRLTEIVYNNNYVSPVLSTPKSWDRDVYHYDGNGNLTGWTRHEGAVTTEYTHDGHLVLTTDSLGRPATAATVHYVSDGTTLQVSTTNAIAIYEYASDTDGVGRVSHLEVQNTFGVTVMTGQYVYDLGGNVERVEVLDLTGVHLANIENHDQAVAYLVSTEGSLRVPVMNDEGAGRLLENAALLSPYFLELSKGIESIATEKGFAPEDFAVDFTFINPVPAQPDANYLGNVSIFLRSFKENALLEMILWPERLFGPEFLFSGTTGFSVAFPDSTPATQYQFDSTGGPLGASFL